MLRNSALAVHIETEIAFNAEALGNGYWFFILLFMPMPHRYFVCQAAVIAKICFIVIITGALNVVFPTLYSRSNPREQKKKCHHKAKLNRNKLKR